MIGWNGSKGNMMADRRRLPKWEDRAQQAPDGTFDDRLVTTPPYESSDEELLGAFPPEWRDELRAELEAGRAEVTRADRESA
jgi:hypothetical protein